MDQTVKWFEEQKFIAVIRTSSSDDADEMIKAAIAGGFRIFDISSNTAQAIRLIETYSKKEDLLIGAGSVTNGEMAQKAINAGAKFLSTHYTERDVINVAKNNEVFVIQGAMTPTEAVNSSQWGADLIKIYPVALAGGVEFVRSLKGTFPSLRLMASGGVTLETAFDYLKYCVAVSIGKAIFDRGLVRAHNWAEITDRAKQFTNRLESLRVSR